MARSGKTVCRRVGRADDNIERIAASDKSHAQALKKEQP
jgi:hypothetical protein